MFYTGGSICSCSQLLVLDVVSWRLPDPPTHIQPSHSAVWCHSLGSLMSLCCTGPASVQHAIIADRRHELFNAYPLHMVLRRSMWHSRIRDAAAAAAALDLCIVPLIMCSTTGTQLSVASATYGLITMRPVLHDTDLLTRIPVSGCQRCLILYTGYTTT